MLFKIETKTQFLCFHKILVLSYSKFLGIFFLFLNKYIQEHKINNNPLPDNLLLIR